MLSNSCNNSVQPILNESSKSGIWFFQMHLETRDTELLFVIVVAQLSSWVQLFATHGLQQARLPCPSPSPGVGSNSCSLSWWWLSNHLVLCCPPLLLPSIFPSIRVLYSELTLCIRWSKYWSFSFSISPSNEYSGLISFRMDCLYLLAVQGTLKSLLQHHSSKASILQCSAFLMVQLSNLYMTTGKTIALTRRTFVGQVTSLLLNMLSSFVMAFLPRSKFLLISWHNLFSLNDIKILYKI